MPIKIPNELPAAKVLTDENIFIMTETRAITQDIRALKILLLNLMPTKIDSLGMVAETGEIVHDTQLFCFRYGHVIFFSLVFKKQFTLVFLLYIPGPK